jgi:AIPR protein
VILVRVGNERSRIAGSKMNLAIKRLGGFLTKTYQPHLDLSDATSSDEKDLAALTLTRSLTAHCISRLGRLDPQDAASHVTDGYGDLGIDGFLYDRIAKMVYIVQSKWSAKGQKQISVADAIKILSGLRSLLSVDLSGANDKLRSFHSDCEDAANDSDTRFTIVFATTASDSLDAKAKKYVSTEIDKIGGLSGLVLFEEYARQRLYDTLSSASEPAKICLTVELEDWAEVRDPIAAYYGRVSLATVLEWQQHGFALFHRNVRGFLGDQELEMSLGATLKNSPENFWYFNNGATLLCDKVKKKPLHGDSRKVGVFDLCGVSVVNGAQTIGIVWHFAGDGSTLDPSARLPLRLISLEGVNPEFSSQVTRALNTQRRIDASDGGLQSQSQPAGGVFSKKTSAGVRKPRQARGRSLRSSSTRRTSVWEMSRKSVPLGKY